MKCSSRLGLVLATALLPAAAAMAQGSCQVRTASLQGSYSGDCVAGLASGRGRAQGADAYEGGFRDGQPTGYGIYTFADGRRFEGEFLDGRVNGRARFVYTNGDVLEGVFRDNQLVGTGRMQRASGEALMVQMQAGGMVALGPAAPPSPAQPAQPAMPPPAPVQPAPVAPQPAPQGQGPAANLRWAPQLDLEDFFPSYLLSIASINAYADGSAPQSRAAKPRSSFSASADLTDMSVPKPPRSAATARMVGDSANNYLGDLWGQVGIRVNNTQPGAVVTVRVSIDEIADVTESQFTLPAAGNYDLFPRIRYKFDRLRNAGQPFPVNVTWQVAINGQPAGTQTKTVRVRSVYDAPLYAVTGRGEQDMAWVFAGFVTEDAPWIDDLLKAAFQGQKQLALGYQQAEDNVHEQVRIVYEYLRRTGVRYSSITATSGSSKQVFSQIVRFPSDSVRTSQANCVDGTVLMASILRKIGIEPIIILGPGHAMLGYYPQSDTKKGFIVVETTALGAGDFNFAVEKGLAKYKDWATNHAKSPAFRRIPVFAVREQGVMPIPR